MNLFLNTISTLAFKSVKLNLFSIATYVLRWENVISV